MNNSNFNKVKDYLLYTLFPRRCALCDEAVPPDCELCERCEGAIERADRKIKTDLLCSNFLEDISAPFYYSGMVKKCIWEFKFLGKTQFSDGLSHFMAQSVEKDFKDIHFDFITSVPLSKNKLKKRGYNQSELLAQNTAKLLGIPFEDKILFRAFEIEEQKNLSGYRRIGAIAASFDLENADKIKGKTVLLCDDIITTGATLNECAKMLMIYGADKVYCTAAAVTKRR